MTIMMKTLLLLLLFLFHNDSFSTLYITLLFFPYYRFVSVRYSGVFGQAVDAEQTPPPPQQQQQQQQQCSESGEENEMVLCLPPQEEEEDVEVPEVSDTTSPSPPIRQYNPDGQALISHDELAQHISIQQRIWLSILGKVYDVTEGDSFYDFTKGSYKFYSGKDASPCFATGNNTPEGAQEQLEHWNDNSKLISVYEWALFYEKHETYQFIGVLTQSRYYDEYGIETSLRKEIVAKASAAKELADAEREKRRKERMDAKMERRKKLYG